MATGGADDLCLDKTEPSTRHMSKGAEKGRWLQWSSHHRMHRSSVRPFFCCGSQVSLNSITGTEFKELPMVPERGDDEYEDMTSDSDDLLEDVESLRIDTTVTLHNGRITDKRQTRVPISKRKKALKEKSTSGKKFWTLKLKGKLRVNKRSRHRSGSESESASNGDLCVCTSYRPTNSDENTVAVTNANERPAEDVPLSVLARLVSAGQSEPSGASASQPSTSTALPNVDESRLRPLQGVDRPLAFVNLEELYPVNGIDELRIAQRRAEMEQGIEVETVWVHKTEQANGDVASSAETSLSNIGSSCADHPVGQYPSYGAMGLFSQVNLSPPSCSLSCNGGVTTQSTLNLGLPWSPLMAPPQGVHTQVDYIHYLVADLQKILGSCYYWGVMDRYQAEKLIENKPEGTFLLRDSAQDEFLFSVSFRRYGRSLHARIEQWNHKFSFDSRDPGVFAADSVCGLIDHYKDPSCCMFFEPLLTLPLQRTYPFSLQHMTRSVICSRVTYDGINDLPMPRTLKEYLRFYHYKQKIRVRRFDTAS